MLVAGPHQYDSRPERRQVKRAKFVPLASAKRFLDVQVTHEPYTDAVDNPARFHLNVTEKQRESAYKKRDRLFKNWPRPEHAWTCRQKCIWIIPNCTTTIADRVYCLDATGWL